VYIQSNEKVAWVTKAHVSRNPLHFFVRILHVVCKILTCVRKVGWWQRLWPRIGLTKWALK
jgi:hypothetical protein